jgi:hypothetical protein
MESHVEYKTIENINHIKYSNLYYMKNDFYYLHIDNNHNISSFFTDQPRTTNQPFLKTIKTIGGPEHTGRQHPNNFTMCPKIVTFSNKEELQKFVNKLNCLEITGNTLHFSHYYEHNIAHGLYDALYPIYLAYLHFFDELKNEPINMFLNILVNKYWRAPPNFRATRDWVLNIFKDFCYGGDLRIKNSTTSNLKFDCLIVGAERAGISSTNKMGIIPGKSINALEKFRNRFFKIYNIVKQKRDNINLLFINSARHNQEEKIILKQLMDYYKSKNYSVRYLDWKDVTSFKEQISIINQTDIQITSAGTVMLNFPFLNDNSININLGAKNYVPHNKPTLLETNICLLSNKIYTDFYDIYKYKEIKYEPLKNMLDDNINNILQNKILTTEIPIYTQKWRELCVKKNMDDIINKMNMDVPNGATFLSARFPDVWLTI